MSTNPSMSARLSHREGVWVRNSVLSSGSATDLWAARVQSVEPVGTHNSTDLYELGRTAKVGIISDPTEFRVTLEENLHDSKLDMTLAGVNPTSGSGYMVSNYVTQLNTLYVVRRTDADSVDEEIGIGNARVTEVQYRFQANGVCTTSYTLEGTSGSYYKEAGSYPHPLWGAADTTSPGGVHGKDARIMFGSTNVVGNKAYRLQSFTIRVQLPVQTVREIGSRALVGKLSDTPNVTVDFDLLAADYQPNDVFFPVSADGGVNKYALHEPQTTTCWINVYDPTLAEGASVIKSFKIENVRPTSNTPVRAQVRQLSTSRWSLSASSESTAGSGAMIVSKTITS